MSNIANITKGMLNWAQKLPKIEKMFNDRLKICKTCPSYTEHKDRLGFAELECDDTKGGCGCYIHLKLRVPEETCPLGKWHADQQ